MRNDQVKDGGQTRTPTQEKNKQKDWKGLFHKDSSKMIMKDLILLAKDGAMSQ